MSGNIAAFSKLDGWIDGWVNERRRREETVEIGLCGAHACMYFVVNALMEAVMGELA